ncbi:unnamed protein product [Sphenostylis stenocarpa]|uniref:Uncharacterized protein n=1 Tax=Sphenostylis stenocarpa TaxID=92480 RepID=A0AA86VJY6_9FABA|nr:unnamed protein product [Sphenostylis stenocarpa]
MRAKCGGKGMNIDFLLNNELLYSTNPTTSELDGMDSSALTYADLSGAHKLKLLPLLSTTLKRNLV